MSAFVGYRATNTFARAAAAYGANSVVGGAKELVGIGVSKQLFRITSSDFLLTVGALVAAEANYRLYLYNVTPPSALADQAAWDLPSGDRAAFLGYLDLGTPVDLGASLYVQVNGINKDVKLAQTNSVFAYLVTVAGITATAATCTVGINGVVPAY